MLVLAEKSNNSKMVVPQAETFADFLFELQMASGLGIKKHDPNSVSFYTDDDIGDYRPFYDALHLESVLPFEEFAQVAQAERKPTPALVQYIQVFLQAESTCQSWEQKLRHLPDVCSYCLNNGNKSYLSELLKENICAEGRVVRDERFYRLAEKAGIFPSQLEAIALDKVIASAEIRKKIYQFLNFNEAYRCAIDIQYEKFATHLFAKEPRTAQIMQAIGIITKRSYIADVINQLMSGECGFSRESLQQILGPEKLAQMRRDKGLPARPVKRQTYPENDIFRFAAFLSCNKHLERVFLDLGLNRAFGVILEEYVMSGGTEWGQFLYRVATDWNIQEQDLAQKMNIDLSTFRNWRMQKNTHVPILPRSISHLPKKFDLTANQEDLLYALACGDLFMGITFESAVTRLQSEMRSLPESDRGVFANKALSRLIRRSGRPIVDIAKSAGCSQTFINKQMISDAPFTAVAMPILHRIAKAIAPYGTSSDIVRQAALLFLARPHSSSPDALFEMVDHNRITTAQAVREYRYWLGLSTADFGRVIGNYDDTIVRRCESAQPGAGDVGILKAIALHMGLQEDQQKIFTRRSRGLQGIDPIRMRELVNAAMSGNAQFSDLVKYIVSREFAVGARENSGMQEMAEELGLSTGTVFDWYHGRTHAAKPELAENFARSVKIPCDLVAHFVAVAVNRVPVYDPALLVSCDQSDRKALAEIFKRLMADARISQARLADALGINKRSVENAIAKGRWCVRKASVEQVARILIPSAHAQDRGLFCELFS